MTNEKLAVLFVHGVGIRDENFAQSAIGALRKEFLASTNDASATADLIVESAYWAPAVMEREDRLLAGAFPDRAGGWFSTLNGLTQRISNGSSLSLVPLAVSGLVRHVPCIPRIHWPTLRWAVSNFVGDMITAAAEWINFYDADDVLAFPLKGLSADHDRAVDEDRRVSVGMPLIGMSPVSHVAYWNDRAVLRPIANSLAWLWNARRDPGVRAAGRMRSTNP